MTIGLSAGGSAWIAWLAEPGSLPARSSQRLGRPDRQDAAGWTRLRDAGRLDGLEPPRVTAEDGRLAAAAELSMPAISLIELVPIVGKDGDAAQP